MNRKRRIRELLDAALALFLARGIEGVTIDEIVAEAGTAKGSFYRYFRDKAALTDALFAPLRERADDAFAICEASLDRASSNESLTDAYRKLAARLAEGAMAQPGVTLLYLQECRSPAVGARTPVRDLADRISARAVELTHVAHERGLLRPFDARVSALAVVGAVEKLLFGALSGQHVGDPMTIPEALISLVLDGLKP